MATIQQRGKRYRAIIRRGDLSISQSFDSDQEARLWATSIENRIALDARLRKVSAALADAERFVGPTMLVDYRETAGRIDKLRVTVNAELARAPARRE
jgi:hypothetical protein